MLGISMDGAGSELSTPKWHRSEQRSNGCGGSKDGPFGSVWNSFYCQPRNR